MLVKLSPYASPTSPAVSPLCPLKITGCPRMRPRLAKLGGITQWPIHARACEGIKGFISTKRGHKRGQSKKKESLFKCSSHTKTESENHYPKPIQ